MKFFPVLVLNLFCFSFLAHAESIHYTIGTYNVENIWDADAPNTPDSWQAFLGTLPVADRSTLAEETTEYDNFKVSTSNYFEPEIIRAKVKNVLLAIQTAGTPDVLALQEFESAGNTSKVWEMVGPSGKTFKEELEGLGYKTFLVGSQDPSNPVSVTPAMISKVALRELKSIHVPYGHNTSSRDIMVAEWSLQDSRVVIMNGHLKSKRDGGDELRLMQAAAIRERINEERSLNPHTRFMVMGDLNNSYFESALKEMDTTGDETLMVSKSGTPKLYNLWAQLKEEDRWEATFGGVRNSLSHILISHEFFNQYGLTYDEGSFHVVGQKGPESKILLTPTGVPYHWQTRKEGNGKFVHLGEGFSDHLPLVAHFTFTPKPAEAFDSKRQIAHPTRETLKGPSKVLFDQIHVCQENEAVDASEINWEDVASFYGKCVRVFAQDGLAMVSKGGFGTNFISVPSSKGVELALSMSRDYDWHPNIDDSRVTYKDAAIQEGYFSGFHPHPRSNQCFQRKVLQGAGGRLKKAMGRISYQNGYLSLVVATREPKDLELVDLPEKKQRACPWLSGKEKEQESVSH